MPNCTPDTPGYDGNAFHVRVTNSSWLTFNVSATFRANAAMGAGYQCGANGDICGGRTSELRAPFAGAEPVANSITVTLTELSL